MITPSPSPEANEASSRLPSVEKLFLTHSGSIKGFINALLRDRTLVEDVLQETFLTVCAKRDAFTTGTNFVAWACTIARYKVLEALRKNARTELSLSNEVIEALAAAAPPEDQREANLKHLESCLQKLPDHSRQVIELHYYETRDAQEIAGKLSLTLASVYVALSRARTMLRRCVAGKMASST